MKRQGAGWIYVDPDSYEDKNVDERCHHGGPLDSPSKYYSGKEIYEALKRGDYEFKPLKEMGWDEVHLIWHEFIPPMDETLRTYSYFINESTNYQEETPYEEMMGLIVRVASAKQESLEDPRTWGASRSFYADMAQGKYDHQQEPQAHPAEDIRSHSPAALSIHQQLDAIDPLANPADYYATLETLADVEELPSRPRARSQAVRRLTRVSRNLWRRISWSNALYLCAGMTAQVGLYLANVRVPVALLVAALCGFCFCLGRLTR